MKSLKKLWTWISGIEQDLKPSRNDWYELGKLEGRADALEKRVEALLGPKVVEADNPLPIAEKKEGQE